jgi:hypothetical protein
LVTSSLPKDALKRVLSGKSVHDLSLGGWIITSDESKDIASHQSIEQLNINGSQFNDATFAALITLPRLRTISFSYCQPISGAALTNCQGSATLEKVICERTQLGIDVATFLRRCPQLSSIDLLQVEIGNEFVSKLCGHPRLTELGLQGTNVNDDVILAILEIPSLHAVALPRERVSDTAINLLKESRPTLVIAR